MREGQDVFPPLALLSSFPLTVRLEVCDSFLFDRFFALERREKGYGIRMVSPRDRIFCKDDAILHMQRLRVDMDRLMNGVLESKSDRKRRPSRSKRMRTLKHAFILFIPPSLRGLSLRTSCFD